MFTNAQLLNWNVQMVGRGAPIEIDDFGYNKPDYMVCQHYFDGLSDAQYADLANRLVKYCNTQLNLSRDQMIETANHLEELAHGRSANTSISVEIGEKFTLVSFGYNTDFINVIRSLPATQRRYDANLKKWYVANQNVIDALLKLQAVGADCENAIDFLKDNLKLEAPKAEIEVEQPQADVNSLVIEVKTATASIIEIAFTYNAEVVNVIRTLTDKRWSSMTKTWKINKEELADLVSKLEALENVDIKELKRYMIPPVKSAKTATLKDYGYLTRKPFPHQLEGAEFLINKKKAIVADEMGAGKTLTSILAANSVDGKKLITCPASLKLNWQKEIRMVDPTAEIKIIEGSKWQPLNTGNGWTIINYDILSRHMESINGDGYRVSVFDEAHYCKAINGSGKPTSQRAEKFVEIADNTEYAFVLTGTPITNATKDIFNLLVAVKHPLANKFFPFAKKYCGAVHNGYGWNFNGSSNQEELHEKLKPYMLRRLKKELPFKLPEKTRTFIPVDVNLKEYNRKVNEYMEARKRNLITNKGEHLVYLNALRHILAKEKTAHTIEFAKNILEQGEPVVIFSNYDYVIDACMAEFGSNAVKLTGECTTQQRQDAVDSFEQGKVDVIVCNLKAGGVGVTLIRAKNMVVSDFDWVPSNHLQGEDRIHRIGQNKDVTINYVYCITPIDEKMAELLEVKLANASLIVDGESNGFVDDIIALFGKKQPMAV